VEGKRAGAARHNMSNDVIRVDGNKATSRSYWFHYSNDNPERRGVFDGFGHYEDELVKVNGSWLFSKRKIYNEGRDEWAIQRRQESGLVAAHMRANRLVLSNQPAGSSKTPATLRVWNAADFWRRGCSRCRPPGH
jgi:hypothetical protein